MKQFSSFLLLYIMKFGECRILKQEISAARSSIYRVRGYKKITCNSCQMFHYCQTVQCKLSIKSIILSTIEISVSKSNNLVILLNGADRS